VGIPFINYLNYESTLVKRTTDSILIVMRHSHPHYEHNPSKKIDLIVEKYSKKFSKVSILLTPSDYSRLNISLIKHPNLEIYIGADVYDKDSFPRLAKAFCENEYMASTSWGSQLLYGAACGMKVGIDPEFFEEYRKEDFISNSWYGQNPKLVNEILQDHALRNVEKLFPDLLISGLPICGRGDAIFSEDLNYTDPYVMAYLLGWVPDKKNSCLTKGDYSAKFWQFKKNIAGRVRGFVKLVHETKNS
jgi:hypothetical protein